jgi:hypothetical protein
VGLMVGARQRVGVLSLAVALIASLVVVTAAPASAETVLGGQIFATGGAVEVEVLPASAGITSQLWLLEPGPARFIATNRDTRTVVQLGTFPAGTELVFGIRSGQGEFRMGPGTRNPDGIVHATVNFLEDGRAIVGFEDLYGGGDRDYDDNRFEFRGGIAPEPPVDEAPVADAGPDREVVEGGTVTLDGTASSDPNSDELTYSWVLQSATGPVPRLSTPTSAEASFRGLDDGVYRFRLTVSDGSHSASDEAPQVLCRSHAGCGSRLRVA